MKKLESAIHEVCSMEIQASQKGFLNELNALSKIIVTFTYIILLVSFGKYDIMGTCSMLVYPLVLFVAFDISFKKCIRRIWITIPLITILGIWNPAFDREVVGNILGIEISGGVISAFTLLLKGVCAVMSAYLLMVTTRIDDIALSLRKIHVPVVIVTVFVLIYRYINVLLKETNRLVEAYQMRSSHDKGIVFRTWGSLAGGLLIRSSQRARNLYDSMNMRGYEMNSDMLLEHNDRKAEYKDILWFVLWAVVLTSFRLFPVFHIIGNIFI